MLNVYTEWTTWFIIDFAEWLTRCIVWLCSDRGISWLPVALALENKIQKREDKEKKKKKERESINFPVENSPSAK